MVSDQAGRGIAVVVTTHGVSARFRTLIRNVTAGTEGLERDPSWPLTVHDTPWHGSKGWQMRGPGRTTGSHQAIGKESNKKILDVYDGGLLVIGKRELKRETTLDAWLNSNFPWVNNFRDIYIQHSLILWGLGITPDTGGKKSSQHWRKQIPTIHPRIPGPYWVRPIELTPTLTSLMNKAIEQFANAIQW